MHYYFYFIDEELGLGYVRVPTWCPFRLQVYLNGHHWLAAQLRQRHIDYTLLDNAFTQIADRRQAQRLADGWRVEKIHQKLDEFAQRYGPVIKSERPWEAQAISIRQVLKDGDRYRAWGGVEDKEGKHRLARFYPNPDHKGRNPRCYGSSAAGFSFGGARRSSP